MSLPGCLLFEIARFLCFMNDVLKGYTKANTQYDRS